MPDLPARAARPLTLGDLDSSGEATHSVEAILGIEVVVWDVRDEIVTHYARRATVMASGRVVCWARCGMLLHAPERTNGTTPVNCIACLGTT